jgi:hypothetical protein
MTIYKHYCFRCKRKSHFKYSGVNAPVAGQPEMKYYSCVNKCGTTFEQRSLESLLLHEKCNESLNT